MSKLRRDDEQGIISLLSRRKFAPSSFREETSTPKGIGVRETCDTSEARTQ